MMRSTLRRAAAVGRACLLVAAVALAAAPIAHAGPGAHGPGGEHLDNAAAAPATGLMRLPDGSVNVPKLAQRRMQLRTVLAPQTDAVATVELNGRVVIDPNAGGRVQAAIAGVVEAGPQGLPVAGQPGKLSPHGIRVRRPGHDDHPVAGQRLEPVNRRLEQRATAASEVEEELGVRGATERPQSRAGATSRHDGPETRDGGHGMRGYAARAQPRSGKLSMTRQTPSWSWW